jgi:hypothetical protein
VKIRIGDDRVDGSFRNLFRPAEMKEFGEDDALELAAWQAEVYYREK